MASRVAFLMNHVLAPSGLAVQHSLTDKGIRKTGVSLLQRQTAGPDSRPWSLSPGIFLNLLVQLSEIVETDLALVEISCPSVCTVGLIGLY